MPTEGFRKKDPVEVYEPGGKWVPGSYDVFYEQYGQHQVRLPNGDTWTVTDRDIRRPGEKQTEAQRKAALEFESHDLTVTESVEAARAQTESVPRRVLGDAPQA